MPGLIKNDFIEKVKEQVDIVAVVRSYCPDLQKRGANYVCKSPFNAERTASCTISPSKQIFKDFSSGKGGNAINFVMEKEGLAFPQAIEWLARFLSLEVEYEDQEWAQKAVERKQKREGLRPLLMASHKKYRQALAELPEEHPAKAELAKRGYTQEDVLEWGIGFAPGKQFLYDEFSRIGHTQEAREIGLIGERADKYWHRVVYPIRDRNGLLMGFAGRDVSGDAKAAKWINPATSVIYDKDKTWFALDRAARAIAKAQEAWIVEGYNDVIAWHKSDLENTIAPCGTDITERQIAILRKLTDKVVLCMDGDTAGIKSMVKYIPEFIKADFRVEVVTLPEIDPDDFSRSPQAINGVSPDAGIAVMMQNRKVRMDGFKLLLEHYIPADGSEIDKAQGAGQLSELIGYVQDEFIRETYCNWLAKESGQKVTAIKSSVKDAVKLRAEADKIKELAKNQKWSNALGRYNWPKDLEGEAEKLLPLADKYGIIQAKDKIWVRVGEEEPFSFRSVSNFSIQIIQHMNDEKFPMKLLRLRNVFGKEKIFDTLSDNLMSPQSFTTLVAGHGNFFWKGGRQDHLRLLEMLFDQMGDGEKIDVLGWQRKGFWVFNNQVIIPGRATKEIDENGVFKMPEGDREVSYYVPSANQVYRNNPYKYTSQKKVVVTGDSELGFTRYASKIIEVHRAHGMTGILFSVASMFQDVVVDKLGNFPMVFLYGPPSTGKDQLIECCQSFFGEPQAGINLEGGVSTAKAQIREFAQFCNMISHLSEYKRGDPKLDGILKGLWDRRGYKRGTIDSHVGSESIPILSSVFLTGNDYPDNDALITRIIWEEMTVKEFTAEQVKAYEELKDMYQSGVSHLTPQILQHRELWEKRFKEKFREVGRSVKEALGLNVDSSRILANITVLATTYELMKDVLHFPFAWEDMMAHFKEMSERQMRKLNTGSIFIKFWDCFLQCAMDDGIPLMLGKNFSIEDDALYFNWTQSYNAIRAQWYRQYSEVAPTKSKVADMIKESKELKLEVKNSWRFDSGGGKHKTSAWKVDLEGTTIMSDLLYVLENKLNDIPEAPATPGASETGVKDNDDDLPF